MENSKLLDERIKNVKENFDKYQMDNKEEHEIIHDRINDTKKESKQESEKMEERITKSIDDISSEIKSSQKKFFAFVCGIGGTIILLLLGAVTYFIQHGFMTILQKLP